MTKTNNLELKKLLTKLLSKETLPNGKLSSRISISKYVAGLKKFYYIHQETKKKTLYSPGGIEAQIIKLSKEINIYRASVKPEPLQLSDDIEVFDLPDGESDYLSPHKFEDENYKAVIMNDFHLYFHSTPAIKIALNEAKLANIDKIIINGDLLDLGGVGRWTRRPDRVIIKDEIEIGKEFFNQLRKMFPTQVIIYKEGNHDSRLEKYIWERCPELYGIQQLSLGELLDLKKHNVKTIASMQLMKAGDLWIAHGHEFMGGSGGENVALKMLKKVNRNIIFGHFHVPQETFQSNPIDDKNHAAWSVGCLCQLKPSYHPHNNWGHGFAFVQHYKGGSFSVDNKKIINGKVL